MKKGTLIIICALLIFLMEPLRGAAGEVHEKGFQVELFGGYSLLDPADFNSIPIYHQKNLDFYDVDRYAYWVQAGNIRSFSWQREGKFRRLGSALPFGFRLKYCPIKGLALSLGLRYLAVGVESRVSQRTILTANDGTAIDSTQSFEPLRIGVRALTPLLGIHFGKSLTSKIGFEAFLSGGPWCVASGWINRLTHNNKCYIIYPNMRLSIGKRKTIALLRSVGKPLRTSQILAAGVHERDLYALRDAGTVERISRGVYRLADLPAFTEPDIMTVASRIPKGVICLVSALHFHGLSTEIPRRVSVAIPRGTGQPKLDWPPIVVYRFSKSMFEAGIENRTIQGIPFRVYGAAKTVADCFRFRNRLGPAVAIESLREGLAKRMFTPAELMRYAKICRVGRIVRPFLDAMQ